MNKFVFSSIVFCLLNISFADDIYLISNKNYCVLTPNDKPSKNYLNSLNQVKEWQIYKGSSIINQDIKLNQFSFNTDVCPNIIFLNEKDENRFKGADLLTNKITSSQPYFIEEIKDNNIISSIKEELFSWMNKSNSFSLKPIKFIKVLSGFKYQSQSYLLIEAHSSIDFNDNAKKGDFSLVVLFNPLSKEFIPVETWFFKTNSDSLKIINNIEGYLDIDNNGDYELVIRSSYYEGSSSILYKIINFKAVQKRSCGCGV